MNESTAYLSNCREYISFAFGGRTIRFKGAYSLTKFDKIKEWENGYIVVDAYFAHSKEPVEDYIDLIPILNDLYIDSHDFLKSVKNVEIRYV
ncbi:MAG: hypothetical protein HUK20_06560 [Fibrobacter sp.]|nr:hypothetical protein [Fibrobacter sp.]